MEPTCPVCHVTVRPTDFYCYNCGKNLRAAPLPTNLPTEISYYAGSLLLPPLGVWWGLKYLKQDDPAAKRIGWVCIILTVISVFLVTVWSVRLAQTVNTQVNQLRGIEGL